MKSMTRPSGEPMTGAITSKCKANIQFSRDDPSVDETTHLKSRIAELESLVRELRGLAAANAINERR